MTLQNLVSELKQSVDKGLVNLGDEQAFIDGRVKFPKNFDTDNSKVEFKDCNYGNKIPTSLYHLEISASPILAPDKVQPVLDKMLQMSRDLQLEKKVAGTRYDIFWTPEDFQQETRLPAFYSSKINVCGRAHSIDHTKVRIGFPGESHEIRASMDADMLTLTAEGNYRQELGSLIEALNPQFVRLRLSKVDADTLLKRVKNTPSRKYFVQYLERELQPKKKSTLSSDFRGGMILGSQEVIELYLTTKVLSFVEKIIGKSLLNGYSGDVTGVTELAKIYNLIDLIKGKRLSDLQYFARAVPKMKLDIMYNHPVLTLIEARKLLDVEIGIISNYYKSESAIDERMYGIVKRLAIEHFGTEFIDKFYESNDYVNLLKEHGYIEPKIEDAESERTIELYASLIEEGSIEDRVFAIEPEDVAKERHLLEFFRQSYDKNPRKSVQRFRDCYKNDEPSLSITASSKLSDASKAGKIKIPGKSNLLSFSISEEAYGATPYNNGIFISRDSPDDEDFQFYTRTSVDSPILLPMQEYACKEMGIQFK